MGNKDLKSPNKAIENGHGTQNYTYFFLASCKKEL